MPTVSVKKLNPTGSLQPGNQAVLDVEKGTSLWEALNNQGHKLPSGCLNGACAACRIIVLDGEANLASPGPNEQGTVDRFKKNAAGKPAEEIIRDKVVRLACQAKVEGDGPITIAAIP